MDSEFEMVAPYLSVVAPFYNEEEVLPRFLAELRVVLDELGMSYEVVLVDDGSFDGSYGYVKTVGWPQLRAIQLAQNVGHQTALEVGLKHSAGAQVITMDSDLQHPPNVIPLLLDASVGVDVVFAVRQLRREDNAFKRISAGIYYRLTRWMTGIAIQDNAADFRLMSRFAVDTVVALPERKVLRLLLPALGFTATTVRYEADLRPAGNSKYTLGKMFALAILSSVQFSRRPLRLVAGLGIGASVAALLWIGYVLVSFMLGNAAIGWPSLMSIVLLTGGLTLFSLGVIGEYLGEIFEMIKQRPGYLVKEIWNVNYDSLE